MGQKVEISLGNGFYESESLPISNQQLVNAYVNLPQAPALTNANLFGSSGLKQLTTTGQIKQVNRGSDVRQDVPFFLNGEELYRVIRTVNTDGSESFGAQSVGTIPGATRASFANNGNQLMILVPGGNGYIYDETLIPEFQQITAPGFTANGNPLQVIFIDSYFVCVTDEDKIIRSDSNDGLTWNSLLFGSAEADPDRVTSIGTDRNTIFVGGSETIELFDVVPVGDFNIQRIEGATVPKGVFAPFSLIEVDKRMMWCGGGANESPAIWRLDGTQPVKVSTTAIDSLLQTFTQEEIQEAFAYKYAQRGAYFVAFSFPSITIEFNTITGRWNERESQIVNSKGVTVTVRNRINSLVTAYGRIMVGDGIDGRIGELSPDVYTEYEQPLLRRFSTQPLYNQGDNISISMVELQTESGVGNEAQPDPEIRMSYSEDGKSFSDPVPEPLGKIGEYNARQVWRGLGRFDRFAVLLFEFSDPVKFVASNLIVKIKAGRQSG